MKITEIISAVGNITITGDGISTVIGIIFILFVIFSFFRGY
jgi:hypothetical protein